MTLFLRRVSISGRARDGEALSFGDRLHCDFAIERTDRSQPDTCDLTIINLGAESRAFFERRDVTVTLAVGYGYGPLTVLYRGDVTWSQSTLRHADWETHLLLGDGARAYRARSRRSVRSGVKLLDAVRAVASDMDLSLPIDLDPSRLAETLPTGLAMSGPSATELTRLLDRAGLSWAIESGQLRVFADADPGRDVLEISQATGMVGSPSMSAPARGERPILSVRTLLDPRVLPRRSIDVRSTRTSLSGRYRVIRVDHSGSNRAEEWYTSIEASQ